MLSLKVKMRKRSLRQIARISYFEPEEPHLDEYVFCSECSDFVYEYCSIHGALLVIVDNKVPYKSNLPDCVPRAALTIPDVFLHLAVSRIPGAGIGVYSSMTLPKGVRFGPYTGLKTTEINSSYCWQIRDFSSSSTYVVDASDANHSNWMRYVNCSRSWQEQNLLAYQYQGHLYYRTIKIIPKFTELLVFYGSEFAHQLNIDLRRYNAPTTYAAKYGGNTTKRKQKIQENITEDKHVDASNNEVKRPKLNNEKSLETSKNYSNTKAVESMVSKTENKENSNPTICEKSNKTSRNKSMFDNKTTQYKIPQCEKSFITKTQTREKPFACDKCDYRCTIKGSLVTHLRIHTGEKPFACDKCDFRCTQKSSLITHLRIHTGEKPFACDKCEFRCSDKSNLVTHLRIHTGEKPFACDKCDFRCTQKSRLITHLRKHTGEKPFACDKCEFRCSDKSNLVTHLRIHTGEKPFACDKCDYRCTQKGSLVTHLRIHTGEKPFACDKCDYRSNSKDSLTIHIKKHC